MTIELGLDRGNQAGLLNVGCEWCACRPRSDICGLCSVRGRVHLRVLVSEAFKLWELGFAELDQKDSRSDFSLGKGLFILSPEPIALLVLNWQIFFHIWAEPLTCQEKGTITLLWLSLDRVAGGGGWALFMLYPSTLHVPHCSIKVYWFAL
jgi:hypothetical protein